MTRPIQNRDEKALKKLLSNQNNYQLLPDHIVDDYIQFWKEGFQSHIDFIDIYPLLNLDTHHYSLFDSIDEAALFCKNKTKSGVIVFNTHKINNVFDWVEEVDDKFQEKDTLFPIFYIKDYHLVKEPKFWVLVLY